MKIKSIILLIMVSLLLCSCSNSFTVAYDTTNSIERAEKLYNEGNYNGYIDFCKTMAGNNDDKAERDNFFNYVLVKFAKVDQDNSEAEFNNALKILSECIKLPLTQQHIVTGLKATYNHIDTKLILKSHQYLIGKWKREDSSNLNNAVIEVYKDEDGNLVSKVKSLPDGESTKFKIGDIKWKDITFANHKTFYLSDKSNAEINVETYYKNNEKTISSYVGATANIDFENNTIILTHDSADSQGNIHRQVWKKTE
jgi:hypothetical protein